MEEFKNTFMRYELKYLVTAEQREALMELIQQHMKPDEFGRSTICNIYYDTEDKYLARRSLEQPVYKEKLRVRSYGRATENGIVFVELKKKSESVVYKRRVLMTAEQAEQYLSGSAPSPQSCQIVNEIDYFTAKYRGITPAMFIAYDRCSYVGNGENPELRVTFDDNILWRDSELSLCSEIYGTPLLAKGQTLMEIKLSDGMPLWLTHKLSELGIYKTSFSKYGNAYKAQMSKSGERRYCCA